jgi:hypothetical protein
MFLHGSLCLELQLDVSSSFPPCIGPSRTSKILKTSSKYCPMVQYLAPLRYALLARRERGGRTSIGMCQSVSKTIQLQLISTCKRRQLGGKGFKGNEITPQVRLKDPKTNRIVRLVRNLQDRLLNMSFESRTTRADAVAGVAGPQKENATLCWEPPEGQAWSITPVLRLQLLAMQGDGVNHLELEWKHLLGIFTGPKHKFDARVSLIWLQIS